MTLLQSASFAELEVERVAARAWPTRTRFAVARRAIAAHAVEVLEVRRRVDPA